MYSDEWIIKGYRKDEGTSLRNGEPIGYRYWYNNDVKSFKEGRVFVYFHKKTQIQLRT